MKNMLIFLTLIIIGINTSCSYGGEEFSKPGDFISSSVSESNETVSDFIPVSGTLRLWMQNQETLNPLLVNNYHFSRISKLIYDSLVNVNEKQQIEMNLAKEISSNEKNTVYFISINENTLFHNETSLTAEDVLSTIDFIRDEKNASPFAYLFNNVKNVAAKDEYNIEFRLNQPDPFFTHRLIFPILSKESLVEKNTTVFPGTGVYKIMDYSLTGGMDLEIFEKHEHYEEFKIKNIKVVLYKDNKSALGGFTDDKLDAVFLDDEHYMTYYLRNDIIISRFPGNTYMFFEINTDKGKLLNNKSRFSHVNKMLKYFSNKMADPELIYYSAFPLYTNLIYGDEENQNNYIEEPVVSDIFKQTDPDIRFIYNSQDKFSAELAKKLEIYFKKHKIKILLVDTQKDEYEKFINDRNYDIILRRAILDNNPDISWMYLEDPFNMVKGSENLILPSDDNDLDELIGELNKLYLSGSELIENPVYADILNRIEPISPFVGIGFRKNGLMQSKRIRGIIKSNSFEIYHKLEDVWVWSGQ